MAMGRLADTLFGSTNGFPSPTKILNRFRTQQAKQSNSGRIGQLDFLRGLALLGVIAVHTKQDIASLSYRMNDVYHLGQYGVQLFFAVSGYTIYMMFENYQKVWRNPVRVFYIKRFLRLYPLFAVAGFLYLPLYYGPTHFNPDGPSILDFMATLTLTAEWHPYEINAVVPGGWSILAELYFYLLFPVLVWAYIQFNKIWLGILFALLPAPLLFASDVLFAGYETPVLRAFLYFHVFNNLPCFLIGIEACRRISEGKSDFLKLWLPFFIVAIVMHWVHPLSGMLRTALASGAFYCAILLAFKFPQISNRYIQAIGRVTYTGYITHFAILAGFVWLFETTYLKKYALFETVYPLVAGTTIIVSLLLFPYTERIWQNLANRICKKFYSGKRVPKPSISKQPV